VIAGYADGDRPLTPRMRDTLAGVARGETARQIAAGLGVAESTVKNELAAARGRLEAGTSAAAVAIAVRRGLL
jgi:LuxR family transcriptional regulator, quorum-sensing system regulator BjaR1